MLVCFNVKLQCIHDHVTAFCQNVHTNFFSHLNVLANNLGKAAVVYQKVIKHCFREEKTHNKVTPLLIDLRGENGIKSNSRPSLSTPHLKTGTNLSLCGTFPFSFHFLQQNRAYRIERFV